MKNYLKLGILLFGIPLILWNCENQEELTFINKIEYNTVSLKKAKQLFDDHKKEKNTKNGHLQRENNESLVITPDWSTQAHDSLNFTDALLANVKADLNIDINFRIRLIFLEVNNKVIEAIESVDGTAFYDDRKLKNGKVYFHSFSGTYLFGYKVEDGKAISRFVPKKTINTASIFSFMYLFQSECEEDYDPSSTFCDNELDEVVISSGDSGGSEGTPYVSAFAKDTVNEGEDGGGGSGESGDDSGYGPNNNNNQQCTGGKVYNFTTNACECPSGKVADSNGNCVDKPCTGDPVLNPEIAPQTNSGIQGALHNTCARRVKNAICNGVRGRKKHIGVDIKNPYGAPIYAVYGGTTSKLTQRDKKNPNLIVGAGHMVAITSNVNGQTIRMVYFHMQQNGRISGTVNAGDIIGYQGMSGNLKAGIEQGYTISHLHIKAQKNGQPEDPLNHLSTTIDPSTGQTTTPCN